MGKQWKEEEANGHKNHLILLLLLGWPDDDDVAAAANVIVQRGFVPELCRNTLLDGNTKVEGGAISRLW